jgi:hypothetical protein
MHAVVLLYKYYHTKQYPDSEYLGFEEFCKLVLTLRPSLKLHMKFTHSKSSVDNIKNEDSLSETEKAILDATNISLVLDPTKDIPNIEKWPVSKVVVLVVDSVKQKCIVLDSPLAKNLFSFIEKDADEITSECKRFGKRVNKKKGSNRKTNADVDRFQQFAFTAVKEATGISEADLEVLESHVVYSLSKEKTCTRFYIVQYTRSIHAIQRSLQYLINEMQGPLVKKSSGNFETTSVVRYYHMLPYATILSDWFSRQEMNSNNLHGLNRMIIENEERASEEGDEVGESKQVLTNTRQMQNQTAETKDLNHEYNGETERMFIENYSNHKKRKSSSTENDINALMTSVAAEGDDSKMKQTLRESGYNSDVKKLSQTALKKKRKILCDQLYILEDEVAVCDQNIKTILNGGEKGTALSLQVVIDCCNEGQDRNDSVSQDSKPKTSCKAILSSKTPCQELDEFCNENNWPLRNSVFQSSAGESDMKAIPDEARESAAKKILPKLRH